MTSAGRRAADEGRTAAGLVSLIMPVWRTRPDWLREAVHSALAQQGVDLELIVVDDGNDVPVREVLRGVDDPRLRILRIAHGGVSRARNAGLADARGDFVRFIDSDDLIDPESTRRLLDLATGGSIGYAATEYCDAEMRPYRVVECSLEGFIAAQALTSFTVTLPSILFPRGVIERAGPWDETLAVCEDWDFVQRALEHAPVRGEHRVATRYRRHASSSTGTAALETIESGSARVVEHYIQRHPEQRDSPYVRRAHAMRLTMFGERYLQSSAVGPALARFAAALSADAGWAAREIVSIVGRDLGARASRLARRVRRPR
jgi:glycosyltransferase involved in cell wall biosynthesis